MRPRRRQVVLAVAVLGLISVALAANSEKRTYHYLQVFREVLGLTKQNYVEPADEAALLEGAYRGLMASLDAASAYLKPGEEKLLLNAPAPGRTGLEVLPSGGVAVVVRVDPGTPAEKAGLRIGDQIWKIDGVPVRQRAWPLLTRQISGAVGQRLNLSILDSSSFKIEERELILVERTGPGFRIEQKDGGLIYLRLGDLDRIDGAALKRELQTRIAQQRQPIVLVDLRGVVSLEPRDAVSLAGVMYGGGPLLQLSPRTGAVQTIDAAVGAALTLPRLHVLIDGSTAGIGEAVAQLLKEQSGAMIIGRSSFGLGSVPELIPLQSGGSLLLTTRELKTMAGAGWAGKGIEPDKVVTLSASRADDDETGDPLLEEAVRMLTQPTAVIAPTPNAK
jgi:carboxyl-terminal processing protease